MSNKILKAKVKSSVQQNVIEVYKLSDGRYNIYLGDKISAAAVEKGEHMKIYSESELEFVK